jgi:hypothetical protein
MATYTITFLIVLGIVSLVALLYAVLGPRMVCVGANPFSDGWTRDPPFWKKINRSWLEARRYFAKRTCRH